MTKVLKNDNFFNDKILNKKIEKIFDNKMFQKIAE